MARWRPHRRWLSQGIDSVVIVVCWNLTHLFRLGFERWWEARPSYDTAVLIGTVLIYNLALLFFRVPNSLWRFSGFSEVQRLAGVCAVAGLLVAFGVRAGGLIGIPRSVLALHPFMAFMGMCGVRIAYRVLYEHARSRITTSTHRRRALVLGAGEAAKILIAGIHRQGWLVVGLLDDDPAKQGVSIAGIPVKGTLPEVSRVAGEVDATHVIIALPGASTPQRRRSFELASASGLRVLTVPSETELRDGRATVERVRAVGPEDLLGREPVKLDEASIATLVQGKTVLVTGAGGSIGSELCLQLARYEPVRMILYELSEFALYQIEQRLSRQHPDLALVCLMGDVKNLDHLNRVFEAQRPHLIFHAAAFKHVPLMELDNSWPALQNNTLGTYHAALAAAHCGAERFVLISTDKAVNPTNVMGASKRLAEIVLSHLAGVSAPGGTQFSAVRFGNVLDSSGSVIPKFKEQIAMGGPVTVTHPEITRYFMTIHEAAKLVLQAAALAKTGQVYVMDMGKPVKIADLARDLIRLCGQQEGDIPIVFTGLRPGEKLYEELLANADQTLPASHPRLRVARLNDQHDAAWMKELLRWLQQPALNNQSLRQALQKYVPEYQPSPVEESSALNIG